MLVDFRGTTVDVGDTIVYVGRQDLKAHLNEAKVTAVNDHGVACRPFRSSSPLGQPTGRLVILTVLRKFVVIRKRRKR